jgi:Flp pilus assembly protein TadG
MRHGERGVITVELAIVLPLLILILAAIVEYSLMYNRQQALHAAAREGGRVASLETSTQSDITTAVDASLSGMTFSSTRTITILIGAAPAGTQPCLNHPGETVTVKVAANSEVDIPFLSNQTVGLTGTGAFRCE